MPTINVNGRSWFYTEHKADYSPRPALVLIHGAGGRHLDWPSELRYLAETAVFAPDLPGHNRTDPPSRNSIDDYASDISDFVEALGLQKVVLAGHSMGGGIAQTVGLRSPSWLAGLILIGTSPRLKVGPIILDNILPNFGKAVGLINQYSWSANARPVQKGLNKRLLRQTPPEVVFDDFTACNQFDLRPQLPQIAAPTLVISGRADQMTPAKFGRFLADQLPHASYAELDAGHMIMQEKAWETAVLVDQFLAQTP